MRTVASAAAVVAWLVCLCGTLSLLNEPNNTAVFVGFLGLVFLGAVAVLAISRMTAHAAA